jgi:hypothetical protein
MQRMERDTLREIEQGRANGDVVLTAACRDLLQHLAAVKGPEDHGPIVQAYGAYAEATTYLLLRKRGIQLLRTPGTGHYRERRPDFLHKHAKGNVYFEVKCPDVEGGITRHRTLAYNALDVAVDLDVRARKPGVHIGELAVSSFDEQATAADWIERLIKKIRDSVKMGQFSYGPCILMIDFGRLAPDAYHPSCLLPVYFYDDPPASACVSGQLWHVALGRINDMIYQRPEFEGKSNLDRPLREKGILYEYPELLGISFVTHRLSEPPAIYSILNLKPQTDSLENGLTLEALDIAKLIQSYSNAWNDGDNTHGYEDYVRRQ